MEDSEKQTVLQLLAAVPMGRFTTVDDLAEASGITPSRISAILAALDKSERNIIAWHRIVQIDGALDHYGGAEQRRLLAFEGVNFDGSRIRDFAVRRHRFPLEA